MNLKTKVLKHLRRLHLLHTLPDLRFEPTTIELLVETLRLVGHSGRFMIYI